MKFSLYASGKRHDFSQIKMLYFGAPKRLKQDFTVQHPDHKRGADICYALYSAIKSLESWWHCLDSTWLVDTTLNANAIWARLEPHVDKNDSFLIIGVTKDHSGWLTQKASDWINEHRAAA